MLFFGGKNETNLGIYIVLVCYGNASYVYRRRRMYRNPSDCGKSFAFLSVVFLQVRHRGIDLVAVMGACCFANVCSGVLDS